MKFYDYIKIEKLILEHNPVRASLGMREDWFWTAKEIFADGVWKFILFKGDVPAAYKQFQELTAYRLKELENNTPIEHRNSIEYGQKRMQIRVNTSDEFSGLEICGICGSAWATPQLLMEFSDGSEKAFEVSVSEGEQTPKPVYLEDGCLSAPCNKAIQAIPLEN